MAVYRENVERLYVNGWRPTTDLDRLMVHYGDAETIPYMEPSTVEHNLLRNLEQLGYTKMVKTTEGSKRGWHWVWLAKPILSHSAEEPDIVRKERPPACPKCVKKTCAVCRGYGAIYNE